MEGIQNLTAGLVTAFVLGHHLSGHDNLDALSVAFNGRCLKCLALWHAVTHPIEAYRLILVDLGLLINAGVEARAWQRPGSLAIAFETLSDGLGVGTRSACLVLQTASTQIGIELGQVLHLRHRRGPASLQRLDAILHVGLLVPASGHAKQRFEHVVTGQGLITRMQLPLAAAEDRRRHGLGIIPPNFTRHTAEELEPLHHAFQDRFGALARQGDCEWTIRVRPDQDEHGNLLAALGKIDVNVAEIRFQPLARIMRQRNKRLDLLPLCFANVAPHGIVAAAIAVFIMQPFEDPLERVPLFGRRLFIVGKNLLDDGIKATKLAGGRFAETGKRLRFRVGQYFANLAARMVKRAGDGPNTHAIAMGLSNACVFVHREHPWLLSS